MTVPTHWPGSFLKLVWLGFLCVSLPLALALVHAGVFADRIARQGSGAVEEALQAAGDGRLLVEEVSGLERRARQFRVLREPELLADYARRREAVHRTVDRLRSLLDDPRAARRLRRMTALEEEIARDIRGEARRAATAADSLDRFEALTRIAREVMEDANRLFLAEAETLQRQAAHARRRLSWEAAALLPLTLVVSAVFAGLLSRPIRRIDEAIQRLGTGDFAGPVSVRGPRDLARLGERLDWLRRRLAELETERRKFLAQVSHELKTPLTAIREGGEILSEGVVGPLTPEQQEVAAIVRTNGLRLQRLIEDLLRFSVGRAKGAESGSGAVRLSHVVEGVLADHRPAILAKGLRVVAEIREGWVESDGDRLRVVVDNLVSNAVKFTPDGGTVRVSVHATGGDEAVIEVSDSGPGIPEAERDRVWEAFFTGSRSDPGWVKGSGLGLAIVAEHVTALRGTVEIGDGPEGGARLKVRLPAAGRRPEP